MCSDRLRLHCCTPFNVVRNAVLRKVPDTGFVYWCTHLIRRFVSTGVVQDLPTSVQDSLVLSLRNPYTSRAQGKIIRLSPAIAFRVTSPVGISGNTNNSNGYGLGLDRNPRSE